MNYNNELKDKPNDTRQIGYDILSTRSHHHHHHHRKTKIQFAQVATLMFTVAMEANASVVVDVSLAINSKQ